MSEVQTRPFAPRGRGSGRGGRGGYSSGARGSRTHGINGNKSEKDQAKPEEEGEVGQLKKLYSSQVAIIKEMFPDWTDEDIVFALRETDGDLELTVERITDGTISQWGEVSKTKKDRFKSKVKETPVTSPAESTNQSRSTRGGRAGFENGRGSRGRGADRGRGGKSRGASVANTNAPRWTQSTSYQTDDSSSFKNIDSGDGFSSYNKPVDDPWSTFKTIDDSPDISGGKETSFTTKSQPSILADGVQKSWATLFAPTPAPKKSATLHSEKPTEPAKIDEPSKPLSTEPPEPSSQSVLGEPTTGIPLESASAEVAEADIIPSNDNLTEDNLGQLPDNSTHVPTATAASTAASSWDPRGGGEASSPYNTIQHSERQGVRSTTSYQSNAIKGTSISGRNSSYQRRVFDQEEAVRMPGNREVDRAAVQFGAFSLKENGEEDVDGGREEAETRAQPPQHSPVAPRASLPPVHQQPTSIPDSLPTPKPISGLPAASLPSAATGLPSPSPAPLSSTLVTAQPVSQTNGQFSQYGRYAQGGLPEKSYDTFNQQTQPAQSPFEGYPDQQPQTQPHTSHSGAFSSAPNDYSSYYTADHQQRNVYNSYYQQQFGSQHQGAQATQAQDGPISHQRSYNGYNGPPGESSTQLQQSTSHQPQSRYVAASEGQNSGHTTPNPVSQPPQPGAASQNGQPQAGQQPQVPGTYHYGHPYYSSPYYSAYMNQYPGYGTGNYPAGPYGAKTGIHQHYQGYNISPGPSYEHSASPGATAFGVSSIHSRDSALGVMSEYARAGSAQSTQTPQNIGGNNSFNTGHDGFSRGSSYQGQGQPHYVGQQAVQQTGDDIKPFNDSKSTNGPNQSMQGGRPGSATNIAPGNQVLPPQSQQAGYGSYPTHLQQPGHNLHGSHSASQYGALGGAGLQHQASGQGHQSSQYGGYQGFGGGNYYGNNQQRGGWGGNYGH